MPNVPNLPGVPPLSSYAANAIVLLAADAISLIFGSGPPEWGLFLNGTPVVAAESVISFDYKQDWAISDYPLQKGAFESYDKVNNPFDVRLRFASGGTAAARQSLINSLDAIAPTLSLLDAVTPEAIYQSVNISHYDYRRTAVNGVGLLVIDVWCVQVRVTATASFSNTKQASAASPASSGPVQTTAPSATQVNQAATVQ